MSTQPADVAEVLRPRAVDDDVTLEALAQTYSFGRISDRRRLFVRMIVREIEARPRPVTVLDIGCGDGISTGADRLLFTRAVAAVADRMIGIEPDSSKSPPSGIFHLHKHALLEEADLEPNSIDVAYAFLVMEHVDNPEAFLRALHRVLKPGGCFLFLTPNGRHFFTRASLLLHRLGVDEWVLRRLRPNEVEEYHYPVRYRFQTPEVISRYASAAGFDPPLVGYTETFGMTSYFRGPLRPVLSLLMLKRRIWRNPRCLLNLIGRLRKPPQ